MIIFPYGGMERFLALGNFSELHIKMTSVHIFFRKRRLYVFVWVGNFNGRPISLIARNGNLRGTDVNKNARVGNFLPAQTRGYAPPGIIYNAN